jgi:hypothetical protein
MATLDGGEEAGKEQAGGLGSLGEGEGVSFSQEIRNRRKTSLQRLGEFSGLSSVSDILPSIFEVHSALLCATGFSFPAFFLEIFEEGMKQESVADWEWDWEVVIPFLALFVHGHINELREKHLRGGDSDEEDGGGPRGKKEEEEGFTWCLVNILNGEVQRAILLKDVSSLKSTFLFTSLLPPPPPSSLCSSLLSSPRRGLYPSF